MKWQPIETAPKGKIMLLFAVTDIGENGEIQNWKMATGCWSEGHAGWENHSGWEWGGRYLKTYDTQPTHWMPLPEPPE